MGRSKARTPEIVVEIAHGASSVRFRTWVSVVHDPWVIWFDIIVPATSIPQIAEIRVVPLETDGGRRPPATGSGKPGLVPPGGVDWRTLTRIRTRDALRALVTQFPEVVASLTVALGPQTTVGPKAKPRQPLRGRGRPPL